MVGLVSEMGLSGQVGICPWIDSQSLIVGTTLYKPSVPWKNWRHCGHMAPFVVISTANCCRCRLCPEPRNSDPTENGANILRQKRGNYPALPRGLQLLAALLLDM